ncbi:MAG: winged helix-turn-helix domain-containing protein, partial [Chthoniobacterales bacterium]
SLKLLLEIIQVLEENVSFLNLNPKCEPQLGRRGLYRQTGGAKDATLDEIALLWVLNLSDGQHNLLDIALRSGIRFHRVTAAADALREAGLLAPA